MKVKVHNFMVSASSCSVSLKVLLLRKNFSSYSSSGLDSELCCQVYRDAEVVPGSRLNLILGPNGRSC